MGSLEHAAGCRRRGERLRAMFSLETMGYYTDAPGSQRYPAPLSSFYPAWRAARLPIRQALTHA